MLFVVLFLVTCKPVIPKPTETAEWACRPLPGNFRDSDLIGTWQPTDEAGVATDEIILREDGTYKQTYQQSNGYRYESVWNRWWIEHRISGGVYVHLEGMRYCHSTDEICARADGGGGDSLFYDPCEDRVLKMEGEVLLAVTGTQGTRDPSIIGAPKGIALMHIRPSLDTTSSFFVLKEE